MSVAGYPLMNSTEGKDMLILTRRVGEKIRINDDIVITLLGVRGNQYKLGIEAPRSVAVHREEIYQRIRNAQGTAA